MPDLKDTLISKCWFKKSWSVCDRLNYLHISLPHVCSIFNFRSRTLPLKMAKAIS